MEFKDYFSHNSKSYADSRPVYPQTLYDFIAKLPIEKQACWDVATGSGQAAVPLSSIFAKVIATDASQNQIENATKVANIDYLNEPAEQTGIPDSSIDLITVAQALHWFSFDDFYKEVKRVAKPNAYIICWCYSLTRITPEIDAVVDQLYYDLTAPYWKPERNYVDEEYSTIPFPFQKLETPSFEMKLDWDADQLINYLNTWSGVNEYQKANGHNPLTLIEADLRKAFGEGNKVNVVWPLHILMGRVWG